MITKEGQVHLLLHSTRFKNPRTPNIHYVKAWRRELFAEGNYTFDCFVLTHSLDTGLYYEEKYKDLESLARRKSQILSYYGVKLS